MAEWVLSIRILAMMAPGEHVRGNGDTTSMHPGLPYGIRVFAAWKHLNEEKLFPCKEELIYGKWGVSKDWYGGQSEIEIDGQMIEPFVVCVKSGADARRIINKWEGHVAKIGGEVIFSAGVKTAILGEDYARPVVRRQRGLVYEGEPDEEKTLTINILPPERVEGSNFYIISFNLDGPDGKIIESILAKAMQTTRGARIVEKEGGGGCLVVQTATPDKLLAKLTGLLRRPRQLKMPNVSIVWQPPLQDIINDLQLEKKGILAKWEVRSNPHGKGDEGVRKFS